MSHHPRPAWAALALAAAPLLVAAMPAAAQQVQGTVFADLDGDGVRDAGEPPIAAAAVNVYTAGGSVRGPMAGETFDVTTASGGCHGLEVELPQDPDPAAFASGFWRRSFPDQTWDPPAGSDPVGLLRLSAPDMLRANLAAGDLFYISMGDSIAAGVSFCEVLGQDTNYVEDVDPNLRCLTSGTVTLENRAVGGAETDDLLIPDGGRNDQYVGAVVTAAPDLVTISIGGNDYLRSEPDTLDGQTYPYDPAALQESFTELIQVRRNMQEILSTLLSELPGADVELNTVYDNEAGDCVTTDFHAAATTLWNQVLRMGAFGQRRPVLLAEVQWEFAHQDALRATCGGFGNKICTADATHPNAAGTLVIEEAVMESLGRIDVAPSGVTSGIALGYQELVATLHPTLTQRASGTVTSDTSALEIDGAGAAVGFDNASFVLSGFTLPPGITPSRIVVGVRYRTTGSVVDDRYRMDASVLDFAPPQYTWTGWDTETPLAGSAGVPVHGGTARGVVNVLKNVPAWRDVSNTLTLNATDDGRATGFFTWPAPTAADVANLKVRVTTESVGFADPATLEVDGAWAWVFGTNAASVPVPGEVSAPSGLVPLTVTKEAAGLRISWQAEPASSVYRVYEGVIPDFDGAVVDAAAGLGDCSYLLETVLPAGGAPGRFFLVAGVNSEGEQGTLGAASDGTERVSGSAACP